MTRNEIQRRFPKASESFIRANLSAGGEGEVAKLEPASGNGMMQKENPFQKKEIPFIVDVWEEYLSTGSVHRAAIRFNTTGETIRQWLKKSGYRLKRNAWTDEEVTILKEAYKNENGFDIKPIAKLLNRTHAAVACKAEDLGLTCRRGTHKRTETALKNTSIAQKEVSSRPGVVERRAAIVKKWIAENGHPKGATGLRVSEDLRRRASERLKAMWSDPSHKFNSEDFRQQMSDRSTIMASKRRSENCYSRTKSKWVEINGYRFFARSTWEANYAHYLEWLKLNGQIERWEHEPDTFWFDGIKRGVRSYLPDFKVFENGGNIVYHEVKGWMDSKSKTKLKRMEKYHPEVKLFLADATWFKANAKKLSAIVPGWV